METRILGPEILVGPEFQGMRSLSRMPKEKLSLKYSSHYPSPKTNCNFCPKTTTLNHYSVHPVFHILGLSNMMQWSVEQEGTLKMRTRSGGPEVLIK